MEVESYIQQNSTISYGFELSTQKEEHIINIGIQNLTLKSIIVSEMNIERWWPNGYGQQKLYNAFVRTVLNFIVCFY